MKSFGLSHPYGTVGLIRLHNRIVGSWPFFPWQWTSLNTTRNRQNCNHAMHPTEDRVGKQFIRELRGGLVVRQLILTVYVTPLRDAIHHTLYIAGSGLAQEVSKVIEIEWQE